MFILPIFQERDRTHTRQHFYHTYWLQFPPLVHVHYVLNIYPLQDSNIDIRRTMNACKSVIIPLEKLKKDKFKWKLIHYDKITYEFHALSINALLFIVQADWSK